MQWQIIKSPDLFYPNSQILNPDKKSRKCVIDVRFRLPLQTSAAKAERAGRTNSKQRNVVGCCQGRLLNFQAIEFEQLLDGTRTCPPCPNLLFYMGRPLVQGVNSGVLLEMPFRWVDFASFSLGDNVVGLRCARLSDSLLSHPSPLPLSCTRRKRAPQTGPGPWRQRRASQSVRSIP